MAGIEPVQAGANVGQAATYVCTDISERRRLAGADEMSIDRQSHREVQIVSRQSSDQVSMGTGRTRRWWTNARLLVGESGS